MTFTDELCQNDWEQTRRSILEKTDTDVRRALSRNRRSLEDFKALISPAAEPYLEAMAQQSYALTRKRFGKTVSFYVPLYLSNLCSNDCTYCGFSMSNKIKRKVLSIEEIEQELAVIKAMKFDSVLLVTGEHESKVGMDYFRQVIPRIKQEFSYVALEVQPLDEEEYAELKQLGVDAVMVYQETYHAEEYAKHHLKGKKMDFAYRLETPDRIASAGIDKVGLGALIGLDDWRTDCFMAAQHLAYLEKRYWRTRYSISFPRLRPCAGGLSPNSLMSDKQLVQLICAFRLLNGEVELSLSTRESASFRDNLLSLGITHISAASKTQPGGYANQQPELEQFSVSDERSAVEVEQAVQSHGLDPVWKDWHHAYSGRAAE